MKVSLLTGGKDPHYALGLLSGLILRKIEVDLIGSNEMRNLGVPANEYVSFYQLYNGGNKNATNAEKIVRVLKFYFKIVVYAAKTKSKIFHIQWENKFTHFDWTLLNVYYKILNKKLVFTAHNINAGQRDGKNTLINRLTLAFLYKVVDHIVVHTQKMRKQLVNDFQVAEEKVTVIPFGINNVVPKSKLSKEQARSTLNIVSNSKVLLFFGNIAPYKGLEYLISAFSNLKENDSSYRLLIAGRVKKGCEGYWENIQKIIKESELKDYIIEKIEFIPDEEIELYCKSADVMILPYRYIFQSGIIFLAYNFGLPVIAADVGSLREYILEGKTGYICEPENTRDLTEKIYTFYNSDLFRNIRKNELKIFEYAQEKYSWEKIAKKTCDVYKMVQ